ncbi:hypothetical protein G6F68_017424 [Rhizopus microsporus]|nr:hypothetical protein G6F68_017424 [Rhizopus microsporus]
MERLREEAEQEAANQVDQGALETDAIKELLTPMNLRIKQITADGHCLYNAFADQLKSRYNEEASVRDCRRAIKNDNFYS